MGRRALTTLTWLTVAAAVASALWLALGGAAATRDGLVPLVLGRPVPPAPVGAPAAPAVPVAPRGSGSVGHGD
ncbi:hypothetical protein MOJ79_07355 [Calidifontimicrobium sp. SYSU G02091]|uniref:hypothetical protein n=1 Tax=Calidifontimicrobium sp. SYSU G02091 TaxID=2926421 RepID=UPI001F53D4D8|nr:hypothetical protein [Calidifontimicrobium sp. SYSU G02091]MCI1191654.1 hypothetical protein [Calidifontimicrobium sp. SYSU G02091]